MFFGESTVGGSSITQQLIKNITQHDSVTVQRKVQEFFQATLVEKNYDKKIIIEEYLNTIYLGQGSRGVRSAAEAYFGKELQTLTIAECASLISITNNPSLFNPYGTKEFKYAGEIMNGMQRNRHRQLLVLGELLSQGYITQEEYDEAVAQELVLKNSIAEEDRWVECTNESCDYEGMRKTYTKSGDTIKCPQCGKVPKEIDDASQEVYSYFVDLVVQDVAKALAKRDGVTEWNKNVWERYLDLINSSGYSIYATIDPSVQAQVDKIYKDLSNIPKVRNAEQLQSAIVVIDNTTGDIVGIAGGVGENKEHFGLNRATGSKLQSGSAIKPLSIYAPGFEQGTLTPATIITDLPVTYDGGAWPKNDNRKYSYSRTIFSGIEDSVNAVAANSLKKIGINYGYEFAKDKFGLSTLVEDDLQLSALALGAQYRGVTVREMASAFATFANDGVYRSGRTWTKVYDRSGNVVIENEQVSREVLSEKAINYTNYCLTNAVQKGTGTSANFASGYVAGKTGTTSSARDRWFCGYTNHYTAAVWCGFDTPARINLSYNPAVRLWRKVMEPLHKGLKKVKLYDSGKMSSVTVCLDTGMLATDACQSDIRGDRTQTVQVYSADRPKEQCNRHVVVEYCVEGNGVANEYCKKFAEAGKSASTAAKALLKLTQKNITELLKAKPHGLDEMYLQDNYVYLVTDEGKDATFKGFAGNLNIGTASPYKVCTKHTKAAWDAQVGQPEEPTAPTDPSTWWN
jgi:penicillin-binding protein 1A